MIKLAPPAIDLDEIEDSEVRIPSIADALTLIEAAEELADAPDADDPFAKADDEAWNAYDAFLLDALVVIR